MLSLKKIVNRKLRFTLKDCELYKHRDLFLFVHHTNPCVLICAVQYRSYRHQVII